MTEKSFRQQFLELIDNKENDYHPLVWINGDPKIGRGTYIGAFSEINAKGAQITIGAGCDIASFVAINVADSHRRAIGLQDEIARRDIWIGERVFVGTHSAILGGARIGDRSVIAAGTVVRECEVPPFSLVVGNPGVIKPGYFAAEFARIEDAEE